jgi:cell division septation protein DedD
VGVAVPVGAQESLDVVDSLASAGRADEARDTLESWWANQRVEAGRRDRQRGLWLRGILTVDPRMASLDFQRLVLEYPGGSYSDEALLRLGFISAVAEDIPRAAGYFRTLVTDYPRSPQRRPAREWLAENLVAIEEAELEAELAAAAEADLAEAEWAEVGTETVLAEAETADAEFREPEPDPLVPAETVSARYAVQVGAFESEERARSLLASVNASGFRARIVRVTGSALMHVRIGGFLDRAGAIELMERVRRRGHEATIAMDVAEEEPMQ